MQAETPDFAVLPLTAATAAEPGDARLHLVMLIDQFPRALGGGERVVLRSAKLLQKAGVRVSIVTFQVMCDPATLASAGCPVYLLPVNSVFSAAALREAWQFGRFLRQTRASVVMTFFESSNLFGGIATRLFSRARVVWNRRDMGILRTSKHRLAYRLLRRLPDHVIAVSEQVRRHAVEVDGMPPARVSVVYNGVAAEPEGMRTGWPEPPTIVTVGNVRPVKGHDVLVEAAAIVLRTHPDVRFQIAGEWLDEAFLRKLKRRITELGIGRNVELLGGVADPRPLLRQASLFVLPSRSEGFSNAIVEAMMAGLPVVATTVGGNDEAVVGGQTGLLVAPEHAAALAEALDRLLADPESAQTMGQKGLERAHQLFTNEAFVNRLLHVLQRVSMTR